MSPSHIGQFMSGGVKSVRHDDWAHPLTATETGWNTTRFIILSPAVDPSKSVVFGYGSTGSGTFGNNIALRISSDGTKVEFNTTAGYYSNIYICSVIEYY